MGDQYLTDLKNFKEDMEWFTDMTENIIGDFLPTETTKEEIELIAQGAEAVKRFLIMLDSNGADLDSFILGCREPQEE